MTDGIRVRIFGDDSELEKTLTESTKRLAKYGAAAAAAGAAIAIALTREGLRAADASAKLARSLDATIDGLTALRMAAGDAGIDGLEGSLNRLNRRLGTLELEGGPAAATIERLGIDLEKIRVMDIDQKIGYIGDRIRDTGISSQEAARHLQQLGFQQEGALELFRKGSDEIARYRDEVDKFGLSLSMVDAQKIEKANDAMGILGDMTQAVSQKLAIAAAGPLTAIAEAIEKAWVETDNFGMASVDFQKKFAGAIASAIGGTATILAAFEGRGEVAQMGLIGYLLFGKKGLLIGGLIGEVFSRVRAELKTFGIGTDADESAVALARLESQIAMLEHTASTLKPGHGLAVLSRLEELQAQAQTLRETMTPDAMQDYIAEFTEGTGSLNDFIQHLYMLEDAVRNSVDAAAESTERLGAGGGGGLPMGMTEEERTALQDRLTALTESMMTEQELLQTKYEQNRELLRQALEEELLLEDDYANRVEQLSQQHQNDLNEIEANAAEVRKRIAREEANAKLALANAIFGDLSTLMNTESRKLFEIGKASAIANSLIDTYAGMSKALAQGGFKGIAMAAAVGARGFANVSAIRRQSFGGGGAGALATGSNTAAINAASQPVATPSQASPMTTVIRLQGDIFGASQVRQLIEQLNEGQRDGGRIILG
jgi:hypothetical protein